MFVADVKCSQATWQTVPNSRADSTKAFVSKAVVRTWHRAHVIRITFGDTVKRSVIVSATLYSAINRLCTSFMYQHVC